MKKLLAYSLVLAIFAFLVYQLRQDADLVRSIRWRAHPLLLVGHVGCIVAMFAFLVVGWRKALRVGGASFTWPETAYTWLVPNLGKYIPGKLFMFAGRIELGRKMGARRSTGLTALAFENLMQLFAALPFLLWALVSGVRLETWQGAAVLVLVVGIGAAVAAHPAGLVRVLNLLMRKLGRSELEASPRPIDMFVLVGIYLCGWVAYGWSGVLLARALGLATSATALTLSVAFVAAWMIGFLSLITPSGLGVREAVLVALLAGSVPPAETAALALVARLSWTVVEMLGVAVGIVIGQRMVSPVTVTERSGG